MAEGSKIKVKVLKIKTEDVEDSATASTVENEEMDEDDEKEPIDEMESSGNVSQDEVAEKSPESKDLMEDVRLFMSNCDKMSTERAAKILTDALSGKTDRRKISTLAPIAPRGGEVYLVDLSILCDRREALKDGFYWRHDGNKKYPKVVKGKSPSKKKDPKICLTVIKSIFKVRDHRVPRGFSNTFQRHAYRPVDNDRYVLIHYIGEEEKCEPESVRGAKLVTSRKIRTVHVLHNREPNSCTNCLGTVDESASRYAAHVKLGRRLFAKNHESTSPKPDITIMEAVEDVMEGVLSISTLKKYANHDICHECMLVLRQAINRKMEAEASLQELHNRIDKITNLDRRKYYRENYATDKSGRCWGCMFEFSKCGDKTKMKYGRHSLSMSLISGMTVMEGIETMLEDEAESLFGLSPTRCFICKQCFLLMRLVVRAQCSFDNLQSNFTSRTHPKSVMAELQGIVAESDEEFNVAPPMINDSDLDDLDEEAEYEEEEVVDELEEEEEEMEDEGETDSEGELRVVRKRPAEGVAGSPGVKRAKEDGSEATGVSVDDDELENEVTVMTEEQGKDGGKKITVRLTAIKPKDVKEAAKGSPLKLAAPKKASFSSPEDKIKSETPRKVPQDRWELQYDEKSAARAGLVQLVLEMTGAKYSDVQDGIDSEGTSLPYPSLPVIRKGDLEISHVVVICRHLGEEYGLCPESMEDRLLADQVVQYCQDFWSEGHFVSAENYPIPEEGRELCVKKFVTERVPLWLTFFEQCLKKNKDGKGFLFGNAVSYADLALYHILQSTQYKYPAVFTSADFSPVLKAYSLRLGNMDRIKRYHKSPRYKGVASYLF